MCIRDRAFTKITHAGIGSTGTVLLENLQVIGVGTFGTLSVGGTVSIGGTLTYEDVTNIDSVGLITARNGIIVGGGVTISKDGDGFFTGIITASSFVGSGAELTGVAGTENIRTNTNATFLQNINVGVAITAGKLGIGFTDTNVKVGNTALDSLTTGGDNTAVGQGALTANTTGIDNTAVVSGALDVNTTGHSNTAVVHDSLDSNTTHDFH